MKDDEITPMSPVTPFSEDDELLQDDGTPLPRRLSDHRETLSIFKLFCLGGFWFAYQYFWFITSIVLVPAQITAIMGDADKGAGISVVSLTSGIVFLFAAPIVGALNDQFSSFYGRRKPWIIVGLAVQCLGLFLMQRFFPLWAYTISYMITTIGAILCSVPYNALVSDVTLAQQSHLISAMIGGSNLVGYFMGAITGIFADALGDLGLAAVMLLVSFGGSLFTLLYLTEKPKHFYPSPDGNFGPRPNLIQLGKDIIRPLWTHRDFRLVFVSRFFFQLGIASLQQYLQYWILDCVDTGGMSSTRAVSIGLIPNLLLAPIFAFFLPRGNRKLVVYVSSFFMILASLCVMFSSSFTMTLVISGLFGIGFGPFLSVEFAMLMDVLPNAEQDAARDMSLWHSALILPQIVAVPLAGSILDFLQSVGKSAGHQCLGYQVVYGITIVYFLLGIYVTYFIQGLK